MQQRATAVQQIPVDMTYGFPGLLPTLKTSGKTTQLLQFFVHHAQGDDIRTAARKVGYSERWAKGYSYGYTKKYRDYLMWLQAHFAQAVVKKIGIDQERVLEEIESIAMANLADYMLIDRPPAPAAPTYRFKRLDELTVEQLRAVEPLSNAKGQLVGWEFRDRDAKLSELAKTMGLLNEKVILEHRHRHLHVHTDLSKVPMQQLEALEAQFEEVLLIGHEKPAETNPEPKRAVKHGKNGNGSSA